MKYLDSELWFVSEPSRLIWKTWDNESVIFDTFSGDTHLLDLVGIETLKILEKKPVNKDELVLEIAVSFNIEADEQLKVFIGSLLKEFFRLGLVEHRTNEDCDI